MTTFQWVQIVLGIEVVTATVSLSIKYLLLWSFLYGAFLYYALPTSHVSLVTCFGLRFDNKYRLQLQGREEYRHSYQYQYLKCKGMGTSPLSHW